MATEQERLQIREAVSQKLIEISAIDPKSLARTDELSKSINFSGAVPAFESMIEVVRDLANRDLSRLPSQQMTKIDQALMRLKSLLTQVNDFALNQDKPGDLCKSIIQQIKDGYDSVIDPLLIPLAFTATQATDYNRLEREAKGVLAEMNTQATKFEKLLTDRNESAKKALEALEKQVAEGGISQNAKYFSDDAVFHATESSKWLQATIRLTITTFVIGILALGVTFFYTPDSTLAVVQYAISKVIIFSILSFSIYWSARNYKSHKHNEITNRHRQHALSTFRTFIEGTDDATVRDHILIHCAQAAFSNRSTGFDGADGDNQPIAVGQTIDVISKAVPK